MSGGRCLNRGRGAGIFRSGCLGVLGWVWNIV